MNQIKKFGLIIVFILGLLLFNSVEASALIQDDANIFTQEEEERLNNLIAQKEDEIKANICVYTYKDSGYIDTVAEKWFFANCPDKYDGSIIFAVNMLERMTLIKGYDGMKWLYFTDESSIVTETASYLSSGETNAQAIEVFLDEIAGEIRFQKITKIAIYEFVICAFAALIMAGIVKNAGGKVTVSQKDYIKKDRSRIFNQRDIFIRTETHRTKKSSSSSGGGRGGSGGHGHF